MTTVMVVEDDPIFLTRFCGFIASATDLSLLAAVSSLAAARQSLRHQVPDVLLVDLGLPDGSGVDLIREVARAHRNTDIMVVSVFGDEEHVLASIEAGATGYILKDSVPDEFVALIAQLRAGGSPISPLIARRLLKRLLPHAGALASAPAVAPLAVGNGDSLLSAREAEVLALVAKGFNFAEVARLLEISPHTVTAHVKKIYQKLAVHSRGEAVYEATKMGLL